MNKIGRNGYLLGQLNEEQLLHFFYINIHYRKKTRRYFLTTSPHLFILRKSFSNIKIGNK